MSKTAKSATKPIIVAKENIVLTDSHESENYPTRPAAEPKLVGDSQTPNSCSNPKSGSSYVENNRSENSISDPYEVRKRKCEADLKSQTGKGLKLLYPKEYKTHTNIKHRSKELKGITGAVWDAALNTFPGFLAEVFPKPAPDYSLDRIDPNCGYVVGNLRWASKQLQSENRRNVEQFMVRGIPMTKPQLAELLGISYDCLRMRLSRGDSVEDILAECIKVEKAPPKPRKQSLAECPWKEGKEVQWEAAFKEAYRDSRSQHWNSRATFYVEECERQLAKIENQLERYKDNCSAIEDVPEKLLKLWEYWKHQLLFAKNQAKLVVAEQKASNKYSLGPTADELSETQSFKGYVTPAPDDDDDEDEDEDDEVREGEHDDQSYYRKYGSYEDDAE